MPLPYPRHRLLRTTLRLPNRRLTMTIIDARGLSCPQPVLMTKQALDSNAAGCEVLVDNPVAVGNVTRYAEKAGYQVAISEENEDTRLVIKK